MIVEVSGLRMVESVSGFCMTASTIEAEDMMSIVCSVFYV